MNCGDDGGMPTAIIPAEAEALDVSLFPNPVSDKITIAMKDGGKDVAPFLYDHTGRMLDRYAPGANRQTIDMQGRPSGIYFMRLYGKDGRTAQRKILKGSVGLAPDNINRDRFANRSLFVIRIICRINTL